MLEKRLNFAFQSFPMKAIWKGSISFGLVNIPIKLYSGATSHRIDLDMIRRRDQCAIQYVRICKKDGKEVPWDEIAKGYQKENGDYVVLEDSDFEKAMPEKTKTIEIFEFVLEDEIPSKFLEKPYIVEPEKAAAKTYALLREALKKSGKVGLSKFVLRSTEHLAILKEEDGAILLIQLRFEEDLRDPADAKIPGDIKIQKKELDMAMSIIDQLTEKFDPSKYKDTYKDELLKLIKKKAAAPKGKKSATKEEPTPTKKKTVEDDLLSQLKASLEAIQN
jgi:DNA end-binding protein Ku